MITTLLSINMFAQSSDKALFSTGDYSVLDGWTRYIATNRGFSIRLPEKPEANIDNLSSGDLTAELYTLSSSDELGQIYMAGVIDFKTNYDKRSDIENFYDGWKEGFEGEFPNGKVTSTNFTFKNKFARKVIVDDKEYRMEGIALFSNGKLFQMTVFRSNKISDQNVINKINKLNTRFFDSFEESK
jgi:hypothetical protein